MFINDIHFTGGFVAQQKGLSRSSCPLLHTGKPWGMWLLGYDYGDMLTNGHLLNCEPLNRIDKMAEQQGRDAFDAGTALDDCPFGPDTDNYSEWRAGWLAQSISKPEAKLSLRARVIALTGASVFLWALLAAAALKACHYG